MCVSTKYSDAVSSFSSLVYRSEPTSLIPKFFFLSRCIKSLLFIKHEIKEVEVVYEEFDFGTIDFLGYLGNEVSYDQSLNYDSYYDFLKSKMDKLALIGLYRNWLKRHALVSHVSEIDYSDPRGFSYIAERQFGSYYEIISRLKKNIGDRIVVIPGDGVGTGSMICSLLEISYESSEPNGIGSVAIGLGIITSVEAVSKLDKSKVYFLANLSEFIDYRDYMICDYIIIDEDRLYPGYDSNAIKYSTHGRLHTNISSFDEYVTFPRVVSKAAVMLKGKKMCLWTLSQSIICWNRVFLCIQMVM